MRYVLWMGIAAILLLAGCSHKASIVGTWTGTAKGVQGKSINSTWQFMPDGKSTTSYAYVGGPYNGQTVNTTGTYTLNSTTLSDTLLTMSEPGKVVTVPHPHPETYQYVLSGDTLQLNGAGLHNLVLTRQNTP